MKFDISIDEIINSKAKMKLLKYLFGIEASMSENELAKIIKVSHMTINRLMKELQSMNLVSMERIGNANVWTTNKESYAYIVFSKIIKDISLIPTPIKHLTETLSKNIPRRMVSKVVLFGSVATGKAKMNSDIDIFILVKSKKEVEKLSGPIDKLSNLCLKLYGNRLSPYVLTQEELRRKEKLSLLNEIEKGIQVI